MTNNQINAVPICDIIGSKKNIDGNRKKLNIQLQENFKEHSQIIPVARGNLLSLSVIQVDEF